MFTLIAVFGAAPSLARADLQTINFDTGTLGAPIDSEGSITFDRSQGFRPYVTEVGAARASSGANVGDIGRCLDESSEPSACESFGAKTTAVLSRKAQRVKVFVGKFNPLNPPEQAQLTIFNSDGVVLGKTGLTPVDTNFRTPLELESSAGEIAKFTVESFNAGDLGIDDVSVTFAEGGAPDFAVSTTTQVVPVVQGQSAEVPVHLSRINGSNGPIELSLSGLPEGLSAAPVTVPGSQTSATLTLVADPRAPDTNFVPTTATLTADPLGNHEVGPAPHTTTLSVRVASDFELRVRGVGEAELSRSPSSYVGIPDCGSVDVPVQVRRDIAFDRDVTLSLRANEDGASGLPLGLHAEILPGATVPPGGGLLAERTLRFSGDPAYLSRPLIQVVLEGRSGDGPNAPTRSVVLNVARLNPSASFEVVHGTNTGLTPRFGKKGTQVLVRGSGFCPGTLVRVGNAASITQAQLLDSHTLSFNVPRYATTGPLTVEPPDGLSSYQTERSLIVDSVRNSDAFQFPNYPFGWLSLSEFVKAFGADDVFFDVNPCWPFGECRVAVMRPLAGIQWAMMNYYYHDSHPAHCFGMSLAIQQFMRGKESYRDFGVRAGQFGHPVAFDLPSRHGPSDRLGSLLDADQARQWSTESILDVYSGDKSLEAQLSKLERYFAQNRQAIVWLEDLPESDDEAALNHAVLAYDMRQDDDIAEIYFYQNEEPFIEREETDLASHVSRVSRGIAVIDKRSKTWKYGEFGGGDDGTLWVPSPNVTLDNPSLPGLNTLKSYIKSLYFGSGDGAVETHSASPGAEFQPVLNGDASVPARGGVWSGGDRPLSVGFEGVESGHYSQTYVAPGFVASARDVATAKGVRDAVSGSGDSIAFRSGRSRELSLELARSSGPTTTLSATVDTHASADGTDTAAITDGGALTYSHDGAPTELNFTLTALRANGGPATFKSGPLAIGRGNHLLVKPIDRDLRRVRVEIRDARGHRTSRLLRTRAHGGLRLKLSAPRLSGRRVTTRFRLSGLHGRAVIGAVLRLMRGGRKVAHKAVSSRAAGGHGRIRWRLPRHLARGRYTIVANLRAITIGRRGAVTPESVTGHRIAKLKLAR